MVKALKKYSLFLSVLLISGYCLLFTTYQNSIFSPFTKSDSVHSDLGRVLDHGAIINASSESASRNLNYESFAEVNEVEEKELAQSKRHSKDSNHIASSLNAQPAFSFQANITRLFLDRHLSIVSSFGSRYIQFCDFRI